MNEKNRITILDGFRVIAILMVLIYHYYDRFINDKYQYEHDVKNFFAFGRFGVEFFFIISGFVITLTLTRCENILVFLKKRLLRLMPGMIVCSSLTFMIFNFYDFEELFPQSKDILNLIVSNTFISPKLINLIFSTNINFTDGAYWSLWVELTFYMIISVLYFFDKSKLLKNYTIVTFCSILIYFIFNSNIGKQISLVLINEETYLFAQKIVEIFNFMSFSMWFLLGIILYKLYLIKSYLYLLFFSLVFLLQTILMGISIEKISFMLFIYSLLLLFIYKPNIISILGNKFFSKLGVVSYSVYLIHQHIGVFIINKFSYLFGSYNWIIGVLLIIIFFSFGLLSYKFLEIPISRSLKKIINLNGN